VPLSNNTFFIISFLAIILVTSAIYFPSLKNQFTNWDDNLYITQNQNIQHLNGDSVNITIKNTFSSYEQGNYHPLTMLTYCIEYTKFKLNPKPYHIHNLLLHILNALLVFGFIWLLTKQKWVALITSILFAIHPMHVESVAWVSERKDVLYSFFYLAALCSYIFYLEKEKNKIAFYVLTFLLFIVASLSKAMAISFPIVLFTIDYFLNKKITTKNVLEKIPFLVVSIILGIVAISAQKSGKAIEDVLEYNFFDRILFSCYGIFTYLWKLIAPLQLSCFYKYPNKIDGHYPILFYIAPLVIFALVFLIYKSKNKDLIFGFGFFIITIAMVLQILPVGAAIIAERYTYLPYIGIFFVIARLINNRIENNTEQTNALKIPSIIAVITFGIICCYLTLQRTKVWHDSISLWSDAIEKDDSFPLQFNSRGDAYYIQENYEKAIPDFTAAIQLNYQTADIFYKRGLACYHIQKYKEAIANFSNVVKLDNNFPDAYYSIALAHFNLAEYNEAIKDYTNEILKNPTSEKAYNDRGVTYENVGKYNEAMNDYTYSILLNPKFIKPYFNRANALYKNQKFKEAIQNYDTVIQLSPMFAQAFNNRASAYGNLGNYEEAIKDYSSAIEFNPQFASAYINRARANSSLKNYKAALEDIIQAKQMGIAVDHAFVEELKTASEM
jgi:tetratricopeptide (TPR) repeat protein